MKRVLLSLLTLAAGPACQLICTDSCSCDKPSKPGYYDIEGVSLTAVRGPGPGPNVSVITSGISVSYALLGLRLAPDTRYFVQAKPIGGAGLAWACSPLPPTFTEQLDSVLVRSRYAYDARHPAGAALNDLLTVAPDGQENLATYLQSRAGEPAAELTLRLSQPPASAGPQQLVLRYRLTNGEVYTAETPVFELQR
jgi:hypothetical protein